MLSAFKRAETEAKNKRYYIYHDSWDFISLILPRSANSGPQAVNTDNISWQAFVYHAAPDVAVRSVNNMNTSSQHRLGCSRRYCGIAAQTRWTITIIEPTWDRMKATLPWIISLEISSNFAMLNLLPWLTCSALLLYWSRPWASRTSTRPSQCIAALCLPYSSHDKL